MYFSCEASEVDRKNELIEDEWSELGGASGDIFIDGNVRIIGGDISVPDDRMVL